VLATFQSKTSDRFDYRKVNHVILRYHLKKDDNQRIIKNIPIRNIQTCLDINCWPKEKGGLPILPTSVDNQ
jgi:hypothetical protein